MATFFGSSEDDDFDIVDGKDNHPGAVPVGKKPAAPTRPVSRPIPTRQPAARPAAPAADRQPQVVPRPSTPTRVPAPQARPSTPAPQPERHVVPEPDFYDEPQEAYDPAISYEPELAYEPEPERYEQPISYAPRAPRQPESAYDPTLFEAAPQRASQPDTGQTARATPTVAVKEKKPATGWAAILGGGGGAKKSPSTKEPRKRSQWAGGRRGVLVWRLVIGGVIALLVFTGLHSIIAPPAGPTYEQVQDAARAAVGDTGFPQDQGGAFALGFAKTFFSYTPQNADLRAAQLKQFVTADVLSDIEANYAPGNQSVSQTLLDGPYLTSLVAASKSDAVATVSITLSGGVDADDNPTSKVLYASFPLHYDAARNALTISGYPTFVPPTGVAEAPETNIKPDWATDDAVQSVVDQRLLPQFFTAWGSSNSADLSALLAGTARTTLRAKEGLHGAVTYVDNSVTGTIVQQAGDGQSVEARRKFQTQVTWRNAVTGATYDQTYRGWIVRQPSGAWTIEDLNNAATLSSN